MLTGSAWLEHHLETFVAPHIGGVPDIDPTNSHVLQWKPIFSPALRAVWAQAKQRAKGHPMLLAGRDVWLLEVLARIEGFPTAFRPDISGAVGRAKPRAVQEDYSNHYLVDTGFQGSVPRGLDIPHFDLIALNPSYHDPDTKIRRGNHQLFPQARLTDPKFPHSAGKYGTLYLLASQLERSPKYWIQGVTTIGPTRVITQTLSTGDEFVGAAMMTQLVARDCLPYRKLYVLPPRNLWRLSD